MIRTIIKLLTFIPWILYFVEIIYYRIAVLESKNLNKEKYIDYINKNLFKSINMKELFLFVLFVIFMQANNTTVLEILFVAIYIYLLIDFFMTLAKDCKKINHKGIMALSITLIVVIIVNFLIFKHLYTTYNLMFAVSIFSSFIVYIFSLIYKK